MNQQKNIRVLFTPKADLVFFEIIKKYNIRESDKKLHEKYAKGEETYSKIMKDTVKTMATGVIPEEKLVELLEKHLGVSKDIILNIIQDIKNKLLPLLLIYPNEKFDDPVFREEISKKIFGEDSIFKKEIPLYSVKKVEIKNVEENAKNLEKEEKGKKDTYREPIE